MLYRGKHYPDFICPGRRHRAAGGDMPPTFLRSKKKKGRQREKRKGFKAETIKRLSPRSTRYCFNHSRGSRIRKFFLSANHGGRQYFLVFHALPHPLHFEIHFAGPEFDFVSITVLKFSVLNKKMYHNYCNTFCKILFSFIFFSLELIKYIMSS